VLSAEPSSVIRYYAVLQNAANIIISQCALHVYFLTQLTLWEEPIIDF